MKTTVKHDRKKVLGRDLRGRGLLKYHLSGIVRASVEETLNALFDAEADAYVRQDAIKGLRIGLIHASHYTRGLLISAGQVRFRPAQGTPSSRTL